MRDEGRRTRNEKRNRSDGAVGKIMAVGSRRDNYAVDSKQLAIGKVW